MTARLRDFVLAFSACAVLISCGPNGDSQSTQTLGQSATSEADSATSPQQVGDCVQTAIAWLGPRLEGAPESGSAVQYANGLSQVEYDVLPGISHSRVGDEVRVCLVSVPENCPPGDNRGRVYSGTNVRTGETWTAPDSQHACGGA